MKVAVFASAIAALAPLGQAASCNRETINLGPVPTAYRYKIQGTNVGDIPAVCGRLWDELSRFCPAPSDTYCGGEDSSNILGWDFMVGSSCNGGMVESSWWEATKNEFGGIDCPQ